jgi:hypothetical protein
VDGQRFDDATRLLATGTSRRRLLRGLTGLALGGGVARVAQAETEAAACGPDQVKRRGAGCVCKATGRPPGPDGCPCAGGKVRCGGVCTAVSCGNGTTLDAATCACVCPAGTEECNGACLAACANGQVFDASCQCACPAGTVACGAGCVPQCAAGQTLDGACSCVCNAGTLPCGGGCVPTCPPGQEFDGACVCGCPAGTILCDGGCVANCPSGQTLDPVSCGCVLSCGPSQVVCGAACVDACPTGEILNPTTCLCEGVVCPGEDLLCDGECVDGRLDPNNCGACDVVCDPATQFCDAGSCCNRQNVACQADDECCNFAPTTTIGTRCCGNVCIFVTSDEQNCGACGNTCDSGEQCEGGVCCNFSGDCAVDDDCCSGRACCDGSCVGLNDPAHCGRCENTCPALNACVAQACCGAQTAPCQSNDDCCSTTGDALQCCDNVCTLVTVDEEHCGACNAPCTSGQTCQNRVCV